MVSIIEYICGVICGYNKKRRLMKKLRKEGEFSYTELAEKIGLYLPMYKMYFHALKIHLITVILWQLMAYVGLGVVAVVTIMVASTDLILAVPLIAGGVAGVVGAINALRTGLIIEKENKMLDSLYKLI